MVSGKIDWLWPSLSPLPTGYKERIAEEKSDLLERVDSYLLDNHDAAKSEMIVSLDAQVTVESKRTSEANAKLATILALLPLAASIILAMMTIAVTDMPEADFLIEVTVIVFAAIAAIYIFLQIVLACRAALGGLERMGFPHLGLNVVLPRLGEEDTAFRSRQASSVAGAYVKIREINNIKISQMAVAHRALRNAIWGFFVLCIALGAIILTHVDFGESSGQRKPEPIGIQSCPTGRPQGTRLESSSQLRPCGDSAQIDDQLSNRDTTKTDK
jgi:hypothetical protein